ncbi:MAG: ATP-binding protein [Candidatus Wallbacteria bacterium]
MEFKKAQKNESRLRIAISGASGSGKTYSALRIAKGIGGKIAVIDTERSSASLYADIIDFDVLNLEPPYNPQKYIEAIIEAENAGYNVIIIDSLSHAWSGTGGLLDLHDNIQKSSKGVNGFSAWKEITPIQNRFIDTILASKCHIITTMRAKQEYIIEKGEYKTQVRKVGLAPVQRDGLEYEFTIFFEISQEHVATASKDRTNLFDGKYFTPSEETGKILINWLNKPVNNAEVILPANNIVQPAFQNNKIQQEHTKTAEMPVLNTGLTVTINEIVRVIKPELKAIFAREAYTTKAIMTIWDKFNGNQDAIIDSLTSKQTTQAAA